jgi:hypothetical protein
MTRPTSAGGNRLFRACPAAGGAYDTMFRFGPSGRLLPTTPDDLPPRPLGQFRLAFLIESEP